MDPGRQKPVTLPKVSWIIANNLIMIMIMTWENDNKLFFLKVSLMPNLTSLKNISNQPSTKVLKNLVELELVNISPLLTRGQ